MASPFAVFRKYQAAMLAVFGVLIIIVFTVGDPLARMVGGGGDQDPLAVRWRGEKLTEGQLYNRRNMRAAVGYILNRLQRVAIQQGAFGEQAVAALRFGFPLPVQPIIQQDSVSVGETVQIMLLAAKARELGYTVTDLEISRYLYALVDHKLSEEQLKAEIVGPDRRFSIRGIYDALREEMLARKLFEDFYRGWQAPPPGQQLEYYARLNHRIQLELLGVPVQAFLEEVPQPSEAELNAYFDEYKTRLQPVDMIGGQRLTAPDPGFKLPHRVSVEYVMGHVEELMDVVRDEIGDEQIAAYYEANKVSDERLHADDELALPDVDEQETPEETGDDATAGDADQKTAADEQAEVDEKEVEFKPLDEVRDYIHQTLARQTAERRLEEKFAAISAKMDAYHEARIYTEPGEEPTYRRPDIEAAAQEHGLKYEKRELLSARQLRDSTSIGLSEQPGQPTAANPLPAATPFLQLVFQEGEQSLFNPARTRDDDDIQYLFWKTGEEPETVPELKDVRDEVVRAWRMGAGRNDDAQTARSLARSWAEAAAQQVRQGKSLADIGKAQPDSERLETEFFSWLTSGSAPSFNPMQPPPLRLSTVSGVDQAGPDFMRSVFRTGPNETTVAMNHPQTHVFVATLLNENKSTATIEENFLDELGDPLVANQIQQVSGLEWRLLQQRWLDQLEEEFDVVWLMPDLRYRDNQG